MNSLLYWTNQIMLQHIFFVINVASIRHLHRDQIQIRFVSFYNANPAVDHIFVNFIRHTFPNCRLLIQQINIWRVAEQCFIRCGFHSFFECFFSLALFLCQFFIGFENIVSRIFERSAAVIFEPVGNCSIIDGRKHIRLIISWIFFRSVVR